MLINTMSKLMILKNTMMKNRMLKSVVEKQKAEKPDAEKHDAERYHALPSNIPASRMTFIGMHTCWSTFRSGTFFSKD